MLPKVVLHDHLDGGLRPATVIALANATGYRDLPSTDPATLAAWFDQGLSGSLEEYLAAFPQTLAVMQKPSSVEQIAYEAGEDLAADGVVYAEVRFAPALCTVEGARIEAVIEAALTGLRSASEEHQIELRLIIDAMRDRPDSAAVAHAAVQYRDEGVVGFDIAGPEAGYPASHHREAFDIARTGGLGITIHAGEAFGPASIGAALDVGAQRIGHGVRIIEDCTVVDGQIVGWGSVAARVHEGRVPLEICPRSNIHTIGWAPEEHPVAMLHRAGFVVTISPDNRLMSHVMPSDEFDYLRLVHLLGLADLETITLNAANAAFCGDDVRRRFIEERVEPGYREARTKSMTS